MTEPPTVELIVVREHSGGVRAIYLGHRRVFGEKPYVSENLPHEHHAVPLAELEEILSFARENNDD